MKSMRMARKIKQQPTCRATHTHSAAGERASEPSSEDANEVRD